ncbi:Uncharacterized protein Rs2_33214 [Raphanus sativus]|nr:Uncharacterized protein Rs2_33214 [Raphanus sativus]
MFGVLNTLVYGGLFLWTAYRWRKLRRTEDRVRGLQTKLRKLVQDEQAAATKSGQASKMTPASIAAMLTASTSLDNDHAISVLSSFAAEEATKTSSLSKSESAVPVSDANALLSTH